MARQLMCISCSLVRSIQPFLMAIFFCSAAGNALRMPKSPAPRTSRISLSSHLVHLGPAARPSAMQLPSRAVSRGDSGVRLQPPSAATLLSVSLQIEISRLIEAARPTLVVELLGPGVVAVPDDPGGVGELRVARGLPGVGGAAQVVGDDPGLDQRGGGAGLAHVLRADDLAGAAVQHAPGVPALDVEVEVLGLERQRLQRRAGAGPAAGPACGRCGRWPRRWTGRRSCRVAPLGGGGRTRTASRGAAAARPAPARSGSPRRRSDAAAGFAALRRAARRLPAIRASRPAAAAP